MAKPEEGMTLCIRLIRSFEYRNIRILVMRNIPGTTLVKEFAVHIDREIQNNASLPPPFKRHKYDCLKIHSYAHGAKTSDTAINIDHEDWVLDPNKTLSENRIKNETEISYFNWEDYERYKANPQMLW